MRILRRPPCIGRFTNFLKRSRARPVWKCGGIGFVSLAVAAVAVVVFLDWRFNTRLERFETTLKQGTAAKARSGLPREVVDLAVKLGVNAGRQLNVSEFDETGQMWSAPGVAPMNFTAHQIVSTTTPGFLWRATAGPAGLIKVADYLIGAMGGLEARVLGSIAVANDVNTAQVVQGEAMRYLAELPWNPDAIFYNRALQWTVIDPHRFRVATGTGASRAEVNLDLDENGLIARAGADARPRLEDGKYVDRPWHGRFWDYAMVNGRTVPMSGEVAWQVGTTEFVYWRGRISDWSAH